MARAGTGMGMGGKRGSENPGRAEPDTLDEADMANNIHGNNRLQGQDQKRARNQRQEQAHAGVSRQRHKPATRPSPKAQQK
jgi:hypothetical protein